VSSRHKEQNLEGGRPKADNIWQVGSGCYTETRQGTDSLHHRLVSELIAEAQTPQRTDSGMHILVSELIPYTTQRLVTKLIRSTTQPRQRPDSLKHRLVSELIP
jgi:hypothetical protein